MFFSVWYYRRVIVRVRAAADANTALDLVLYILVVWGIIALMTGEVTNILLNLVLTRVIPMRVLRVALRGPGSAVQRLRTGIIAARA
jgi:hypothetical protein